MRLSRRHFELLVHRALRSIPTHIARYLENISVDVEHWPDAETCRSLGLTDPSELMGLYQGTPLTERSVEDQGMLPDRIVIYQGSVEASAVTRSEIVEEVRATVLHEIGHHFGLDEDDLEQLGYD